MKVLDLFAGIGGFTLGLERAGFETVAFCEIEPYAQKVLAKNWPEVPIYDDVRTITADRLASDGIRVDVITGGFPCQDISVSGNQAGIQDGTRSGLWSECARLLGEIRPKYAIFENVTNLLNGHGGDWFKRVLWDISEVGYDAEWHCIPASAIGAPHRRDRVFIVAYPDSSPKRLAINGLSSKSVDCNTSQQQSEARNGFAYGSQVCRNAISGIADIWRSEPDVGRVANGIPARSHRLKCLGNAVVPPIPELIGRAIMEKEGANEQVFRANDTDRGSRRDGYLTSAG
jgi:DNA (cytosine-5)-methyltransferase 1